MAAVNNTARRDDESALSSVFPLPEDLTLRIRTKVTEADKKAEILVRDLISEYGRNPDEVLHVVARADWPASDDAPDFPFPQLIVDGVYWKGLDAIEAYVDGMRRLHAR